MTRRLRDEYSLVPHWFHREAVPIYELTLAEQAVYHVLCDHADTARMTWVPQKLMIEQSGVSRSAVKLATKRLLAVGLVEVVVHETSHRARRYHLAEHMPLPAKVVPLPTRRARFEGSAWVAVDEG